MLVNLLGLAIIASISDIGTALKAALALVIVIALRTGAGIFVAAIRRR
jgi:hypothetical protein